MQYIQYHTLYTQLHYKINIQFTQLYTIPYIIYAVTCTLYNKYPNLHIQLYTIPYIT